MIKRQTQTCRRILSAQLLGNIGASSSLFPILSLKLDSLFPFPDEPSRDLEEVMVKCLYVPIVLYLSLLVFGPLMAGSSSSYLFER